MPPGFSSFAYQIEFLLLRLLTKRPPYQSHNAAIPIVHPQANRHEDGKIGIVFQAMDQLSDTVLGPCQISLQCHHVPTALAGEHLGTIHSWRKLGGGHPILVRQRPGRRRPERRNIRRGSTRAAIAGRPPPSKPRENSAVEATIIRWDAAIRSGKATQCNKMQHKTKFHVPLHVYEPNLSTGLPIRKCVRAVSDRSACP